MISNGTVPMPAITEWLTRCASARSAGETIPVNALFRAIVQHGAWLCAVNEQDMISATAGAADVYCDSFAGGPTEGLQQIDGLAVAAALGKDIVELRVYFEAGTPPLVCDQGEVAVLRSFLQVVVVEALLQRLHDGTELQVPAPFERLRSGEFYVLCVAGSGGEGHLKMALAPDRSGRKLVAAFTAQDGLQAFLSAREVGVRAEEMSARLTGRELFQSLLSDGIDGVVFNPVGPTQPIALASDVATLVLEG